MLMIITMTMCSQLIKQLVVRASKQQVDGIVQMLQEWAREGQVRNWFLLLHQHVVLMWLLQVLRQQAALHLLCIVVDAIGERVMRYGPALLHAIVPVLEANNRKGAGASGDAAADDADEEEDGDDAHDGGDDAADEGGNVDVGEDAGAAVDGGAAAAPNQDSWLQQGIFGEETHSGPSGNSDWQVLYFAVFAFEKIELNCPALLRQAAAAPLTRLMCGATALLHSHPWVSRDFSQPLNPYRNILISICEAHPVITVSGESCRCEGCGRLLREQGDAARHEKRACRRCDRDAGPGGVPCDVPVGCCCGAEGCCQGEGRGQRCDASGDKISLLPCVVPAGCVAFSVTCDV